MAPLPVESAAHPKVPGAPWHVEGCTGIPPQGPEESTSLMSGFFLRASADMAASLLDWGGLGERRGGEMCVCERERVASSAC